MAYLEAAGLRRRVWLSLIALTLGCAAIMGPIVYSANVARPFTAEFSWLQWVGVSAVGGSVAWLYRRVRCQDCRLQFVRYAWGNLPHDRWFQWLNSFEACPKCGASANRALQPTRAAEPDEKREPARVGPHG